MKSHLLLILLLTSRVAVTTAGNSNTTLALLPATGDRQPATAVMNRLEAAWLQQPNVTLVERQALEKILTEHQMTGVALTDVKARVQLGRFVPADLLVFLDSVPKLPKPATRIRVTESKSGIVLASQIFENEMLLKNQSPLDLIQVAIRKQALPVSDRHVLGFLDFRSEESGPSLDGLATALGTLVMADLVRAPQIIVLERQHLQHLRTERELTSIEQELRTSVRLLEGGVRRSPDRSSYLVTVSLRPLAGGEPLTGAVAIPTNAAVAGADRVAACFADLLRTKRPETSKLDPALEVRHFVQQVPLWEAWGDKDRALQAAETAFALESSQSNRWLLARTLVFDLPAEARLHTLAYDQPRDNPRTTLRQAIRATEMVLDYYGLRAAVVNAGDTNQLVLPFMSYIAASRFADETPANREMKAELVQLEDAVFRKRLEFYRDNYDRTGPAYWNTWTERIKTLPFYHEGHPEMQAALLQEAVTAFTSMPDQPGPFSQARLGMLVQAVRLTFTQIQADVGARLVRLPRLQETPNGRAVFLKLFQVLTQNPDPYVRYIGHAGRGSIVWGWWLGDVQSWPEAIAAHRAMEKILLEEITPQHRYRSGGDGVILGALELTPGFNPKSEDETEKQHEVDALSRLFRQVQDTPDVRVRMRSLGTLMNTPLRNWLNLLAENGRAAQVVEFHKALVAAFPHTPEMAAEQARYESLIGSEKHEPQAPRVETDPVWQEYEILPLTLRFPLTPNHRVYARSLVSLMSQGNRLYCLRPIIHPKPADGGKPYVSLELTIHWLPSGETLQLMGVPVRIPVETRGSVVQYDWPGVVQATELAGDTLYVGTKIGVVAISPATQSWKLIGPKEGLPGQQVRALGWYEGKLYFGIGLSPYDTGGDDQAVFGAYDPVTKQFQVLAAEKAVATQDSWNGTRFGLDDIVADPDHSCLWLKDRKSGLWKFTPAMGAFDKVLHGRPFVILPGSRYIFDFPGLRSSGTQNSPSVFFRPSDLSQTPIPGIIKPFSLHQQSYVLARSGDDLMLSAMADNQTHDFRARTFWLLRRGRAPALLARLPDGKPFPAIGYLQETPLGIFAMSETGESLLIRRKDREAEYRLAELRAASRVDRETQLLAAAEAGQMTELEALVRDGVNINAADGRNWTPLDYAIDRKHGAVALWLIQRGAAIQHTADGRCSVLTLAAKRNDVKVVQELLTRRIPVDVATNICVTPLMAAAVEGATEAAQILIAHGADVNWCDPNLTKPTILLKAAFFGHLPVVKLLVDHGADVEVADSNGNTALMAAACGGHTNVIAYLARRGARLEAIDRRGYSALAQAIFLGKEGSVGALAEAGANVNRGGNFGRTPLILAADKQASGMVRSLLQHGAAVNVQDEQGLTPLIYATRRNDTNTIALLLDAGADPEIASSDEPKTALRPINVAGSPEAKALISQAIEKKKGDKP